MFLFFSRIICYRHEVLAIYAYYMFNDMKSLPYLFRTLLDARGTWFRTLLDGRTHDDDDARRAFQYSALKGRFHDIFLRANFSRQIFARRNISARVHSTTKSVFCVSPSCFDIEKCRNSDVSSFL